MDCKGGRKNNSKENFSEKHLKIKSENRDFLNPELSSSKKRSLQ